MDRKLIFLLNPKSGTRDKGKIRKAIEAKLAQHQLQYEFLPTNSEGNYSAAEEKIIREQVRDVIVIGGDGTISHAVNALRHLPVRFGIIPTGSGNGLALAAGIPRDPAKALDIALTGEASSVDAFRINGHFSCMLSGIGFDAKVAHDFARQKKRGLWTYVKVSAMNFFGALDYPFRIQIPGKDIDTEAYFISIANSNQFGNNFTIAPKAHLSDGLVDVVVVQKMNKLQVILSVIYQIKYGDVQEDMFRKGILYFQTKELEIINTAKAPLHIDGDPYPTADQFRIEVIPNAFHLIQPVSS